ncbi:hypothetical protein G7062_10165 [Erysipelothrix sp. HDW6C]|uniref:hypothetical protein n=1 Tax=Erysipelothrix sp. HDW6C TaxID=2714930 RepID=UPI00140E2F86|nr:hypothetical protein [Erysipelothrix sp. HDW6C]QIK70645.1 hypothetical protein G7062_10165 [Erysipelothrix sp. HDW6C]
MKRITCLLSALILLTACSSTQSEQLPETGYSEPKNFIAAMTLQDVKKALSTNESAHEFLDAYFDTFDSIHTLSFVSSSKESDSKIQNEVTIDPKGSVRKSQFEGSSAYIIEDTVYSVVDIMMSVDGKKTEKRHVTTSSLEDYQTKREEMIKQYSDSNDNSEIAKKMVELDTLPNAIAAVKQELLSVDYDNAIIEIVEGTLGIESKQTDASGKSAVTIVLFTFEKIIYESDHDNRYMLAIYEQAPEILEIPKSK